MIRWNLISQLNASHSLGQSLKMSSNLISLLLLVLMGNLVLTALIVPRLQDDNIQLTPMGENKYSLRIQNLDGSVREEQVEEIAPGELKVLGKLNQLYGGGQLMVIYEAGRNGYIAKYIYTQQPGSQFGLAFSAASLKSAAG